MKVTTVKKKNFIDGAILRAVCLYFNTRNASNMVSLALPLPDVTKTWTIFPTVTYRHIPSKIQGPSFTLKLKWLKWNILSFRWARFTKDEIEDDYLFEVDYLDESEYLAPEKPQ